jgi:hypothetical protein
MSNQPSDRVLASVIIEWENMQFSENDRCRAMLQELASQIQRFSDRHAELSSPFEVLIQFDDDRVSRDAIEAFIRPFFPKDFSAARVQCVASSGHSYYSQKNQGAKRSQGEFIVFLDSDVIPDTGWLNQLLSTFDDPEVFVACGNCYVAPEGIVSKAFALGWFFSLRSSMPTIRKQSRFFANNVAFRRDVALEYPFQPIDGASRGACRLLARQLEANGIPIHLNTAAQVSHPAPNGLAHTMARAISQGRDNLLLARRRGRGSVPSSLARVFRHQIRSWLRIMRHRRDVGMRLTSVPTAILIATLYYSLYFVGDLLLRVCPKYMETRFQV